MCFGKTFAICCDGAVQPIERKNEWRCELRQPKLMLARLDSERPETQLTVQEHSIHFRQHTSTSCHDQPQASVWLPQLSHKLNHLTFPNTPTQDVGRFAARVRRPPSPSLPVASSQTFQPYRIHIRLLHRPSQLHRYQPHETTI